MRAPPFIRRTKEEARARATELLLQANRAGADFSAIARENSDDLGSRERGGDVGLFGRQGQMVEEFARASFALEVGQVSDIVETPFGYHIIQRYR
jgi:parvulin-like peptidyl-prolyl isomerase